MTGLNDNDGECPICLEQFKTNNKRIIGCTCRNPICQNCVKTIIENNIGNPQCPYCHAQYTIQTVLQAFDAKGMTKYLKAYNNFIIERERQLIPEIMPIVERFQRMGEYWKLQRALKILGNCNCIHVLTTTDSHRIKKQMKYISKRGKQRETYRKLMERLNTDRFYFINYDANNKKEADIEGVESPSIPNILERINHSAQNFNTLLILIPNDFIRNDMHYRSSMLYSLLNVIYHNYFYINFHYQTFPPESFFNNGCQIPDLEFIKNREMEIPDHNGELKIVKGFISEEESEILKIARKYVHELIYYSNYVQRQNRMRQVRIPGVENPESETSDPPPSNPFKIKCPTRDCLGYLNEEYECIVCNSKFCKKCFEPISNNQQSHNKEYQESTVEEDEMSDSAESEITIENQEFNPEATQEESSDSGAEVKTAKPLSKAKTQKPTKKTLKSKESGSDSVKHKCKKEDVKTFKAMMKNSKPCPKCSELIWKNGGCSQMFCTMCHCCFDWNTGKEITTFFHNPHHQQWLEQHPEMRGNERHGMGGAVCADEDPVMVNIYLYHMNNARRNVMFDIRRRMNIVNHENVRIDKYTNLRVCNVLKLCTADEYHKKIVAFTNKISYEQITYAILAEWDNIVLDILRHQRRVENEMFLTHVTQMLLETRRMVDSRSDFKELLENPEKSTPETVSRLINDVFRGVDPKLNIEKARSYLLYRYNSDLDVIRLIREETNFVNETLSKVSKGWYNRKFNPIEFNYNRH
jgi:hypothetical protein